MPARQQMLELDLPFERALPDRLRPMLPMPAAAPFDSPAYAFEVAWEGIRALAAVSQGQVNLWGRGLRDLTSRYPEVQVIAAQAPPDTIFDGELIITDLDGRPDRPALEVREQAASDEVVARAAAAHPVTYVIYDILYMRGRSLMKEPLQRRQGRLRESVGSSGRVYVADPVIGEGLAFFDAARDKGLEGVVAKRLDSPYRAGQRHPDWLAIDAARHQDFVLMGYVPGNPGLEALIVGTYDGRGFQPAGRVVGGYDSGAALRLRKTLDGLLSGPTPNDPRAADDRIRWVEPQVVVNVRFSEWDRHGQLRFPIFSGLRREVSPEECVRTAVVEPPDPQRPAIMAIPLPRLPIE
jgi:bifunctional non-homologous end joining protein LigD